MLVSTGLSVPMQWDIGINQIDPKVIKSLVSSIVGLTSRRGNERLDDAQKVTLHRIRREEAKIRRSTDETIQKAIRQSTAGLGK